MIDKSYKNTKIKIQKCKNALFWFTQLRSERTFMCSYLVLAFKMLILFDVTKTSLTNVILNHTIVVVMTVMMIIMKVVRPKRRGRVSY
jgi:hypothetical protein